MNVISKQVVTKEFVRSIMNHEAHFSCCYLELVGRVERHFHYFLEAVSVVHGVSDSELGELEQSGLRCIANHNTL